MKKQFGRCRDLFISSLLAVLVAFLLMGCSLKFNEVSPISLDIDALLGASPEEFEAQLKEMGDALLVSETLWEETDKIPRRYTGAKQDLVGTLRRRSYEIVLADTARRPRVNVSFHHTYGGAWRIWIDFDGHVSKLDALEQLGFDRSDLSESPYEKYTWLARTEGRVWLIYEVPNLDVTIGSAGKTELIFIHRGERGFSRKTSIVAWISSHSL